MSVSCHQTFGTYREEYRTILFELDGNSCTIVCPNQKHPNGYWVWRAEFLGSFDTVDLALLQQGWSIAYCKLSNLFGCPQSIQKMKQFHDYVVEHFELASRADLFGFSRGGLYAANYTLAYPQDVSVLYLDAPVLDIKSWPMGLFQGVGSEINTALCMEVYQLTEETLPHFKGSPIDHIDDLLQTQVPILLIAGAEDEVVPYHENGALLEQAAKACDYDACFILKPHCSHHPHSLEDPTPAVDFIVNHK